MSTPETQFTPFIHPIRSYDFHTYYNANTPQHAQSRTLIANLRKQFSTHIEAGAIRVYRFHDEPLGPHPIGMVECDVRDSKVFLELLQWFQLNHAGLSVLIHPRTDKGDLVDHTELALWLGHKVRLITDFLRD